MFVKAIPYRFVKLFVFISVIVLIMISCKLGEDNPNNIGTTGFNLIGTQVIGPTGGEINLDSIIVKVPSNAFDENTEINIFVGAEKDGFDEYGNSVLYQIDGLPSAINKPIRLSIKYHGTIEGDTLVAIGKSKYAVSLDSSLYSYHTENASDSAGYLVYDLPANSYLGKLTQHQEDNPSSPTNIIGVGGNKRVISSRGHFMLTYPLSNNRGFLMGDYFEVAYAACETMGFDLSARDWTKYPANVLVKPIDYSGFYSASFDENTNDKEYRSQINEGDFTIDQGILTDDLDLRTTCGHEFLHLVQNLYEFSSPYIEPEQVWLMEATAVWVEEGYGNITNFFSPVIYTRERYIFDGWQFAGRTVQSNDQSPYAEQGYGLSTIIKDIAMWYGVGAIVKIFEKIKTGTLPNNAVDPVDAVLSVLDEPVGTFWHRVLSFYLLGIYYNNQVNSIVLDNSASYTEVVTIDPLHNTHSLKYNYHDLSGKLFKVKFGDLSSLDKVPLSFTVDDPTNCGILICKYKQGSEIGLLGEFLPGGAGQVSLKDVKPIFDDGYELVVMVSNSKHDKNANYQGTNEVELSIEIKEPEIGVRFPYCRLKISVEHHYDGIFGPQSVSSLFCWGTAEGTWNDTVFTAIIDERIAAYPTTGSIEIKINSQQDKVMSFYATQTTTCDTSDWFSTRMCQGTGPLPLTNTSDNYSDFSVSGYDISNVLQTYTYSSSQKYLDSYTVHDNSSVWVEFDDSGG